MKIGYDHFCGNEYASNSKYNAISYAKNYYQLDSLDKSISLLLPHIFRNSLTRNDDAVKLALAYMLEKYEKDFLIDELERGFNEYVKKKPRPNSRTNKYFINFLGKQVQLYMYEPDDISKESQKVKEVIENELIYIMLKAYP